MYITHIPFQICDNFNVWQSAPQILISTAFIVKATATKSPIVYISLATSFLSLADRVSADDKAMFRKEWKSMIIPEFPKINYRWFIRVFCWRFLEISSRICLLTLAWINLGGISIFIMVGCEFMYLTIICYGLGTLSLCQFAVICNSSSMFIWCFSDNSYMLHQGVSMLSKKISKTKWNIQYRYNGEHHLFMCSKFI